MELWCSLAVVALGVPPSTRSSSSLGGPWNSPRLLKTWASGAAGKTSSQCFSTPAPWISLLARHCNLLMKQLPGPGKSCVIVSPTPCLCPKWLRRALFTPCHCLSTLRRCGNALDLFGRRSGGGQATSSHSKTIPSCAGSPHPPPPNCPRKLLAPWHNQRRNIAASRNFTRTFDGSASHASKDPVGEFTQCLRVSSRARPTLKPVPSR